MITSVYFQNFRCFTSVQLDNLAELNLFSGAQSSGKTTILESIFLLLRGKSFRPCRRSHLLGNKSFPAQITVHMEDSIKITHLFTSQQRSHLVNDYSDSQIHTVAKYPVFYCSKKIDYFTSTFRHRRNILFSFLYYIYPRFHSLWKEYEKVHANRMLLTKQILSGSSPSIIIPWNLHLIRLLSEFIPLFSELNKNVSPLFKQICANLLPDKNLEINFSAGFSPDYLHKIEGMPDFISTTYDGPHKSAFLLVSNSLENAVASLSDSELFICSIILVYCVIPFFAKPLSSTVLIDDLDPQLFAPYQQLLDFHKNILSVSLASDVQSFVTSSSIQDQNFSSPRLQMFHVEHL